MKASQIPVIDIAELGNRKTQAAVNDACREWGFFQVVNHGLEPGVIAALQNEMSLFFAQPTNVKREISRTTDNPWGFFDQELTKNTPDWKEIFDYGPMDDAKQPQWPQSLPGFKPAVLAYYTACENLAFRLLEIIAANLGMPTDYLNRDFKPNHTSFLRMNYYPVCPTPEFPAGLDKPSYGHLGINHHTDAGAVTVLLQDDQAGLEVYRGKQWHLVETRSDALVINIGDIVQVWSNDQYHAPLHRVRANAKAERFSVPFFFNPAYQSDYAPLPTMVDNKQPARYRAINWGEFRALRAGGDYADSGEEVQISHYRTTQ